MPDPTDQPPLPAGPPIVVTVTDIADQELDPKQEEKLRAAGRKEAGEPQGLWGAFWAAIADGFLWVLSTFIGLLDKVFAIVARAFLAAQGEKNPQFYELTAALITDLTGVQVDSTQLIAALQQRGRVAAMRAVGGGLFDILSGEFAGVEQQAVVEGFTEPKGSGIGGLPDTKLSPKQGVDAARAFLGFAMSFAVREGNTDMLAEILPSIWGWAPGRAFKDFAEDFSKSLGIGRLLRLVMRPLINTMVGIPLTWALNQQYRPKELTPAEATRAQLRKFLTTEQLRDELRRAGYNEDKINSLIEQNLKDLTLEELKNLNLAGLLSDDDLDLYLARLGFHPDDAALWHKADDLAEVRKYSITRATTLVNDFLAGDVSRTDLEDALVAKGIGGTRLLLSEKEVSTLLSIADHLAAFPRLHLSVAQMHKAFISGIIDVTEWDDFLARRGYSSDDRKILTLQLLMDAGKQAEADKLKEARAAAKAAKAATPPGSP
jgi:hypothetical protein